MAFRWRIRHKLMLGLGLVMAILGLLLAGTVKGMSTYRAALRTADSKIQELDKAEKLKEQITKLANHGPRSSNELAELRLEMQEARKALDDYDDTLGETVALGRDIDNGYTEGTQVKALHDLLDSLEQALPLTLPPQVHSGDRPALIEQEPFKGLIGKLTHTSGDLILTIVGNLRNRVEASKRTGTVSLIVVCATSVLASLMLLTLSRFFYRWVFYPVRDLQEGAGRVAQGDFEHRIEVNSGDEMEDLAAAFNDMTGRLREIYRDLERQVNERSRQLVRSERLASVGFLAAGVAHEINNPLASIAFCSEALLHRLAGVLGGSSPVTPEDCQTLDKYLKMIQQEAFRCKRITQRLLEFSRGSEGRREQTDVGEVIQSVLDVVQTLPTSRGKYVVFQPAGRVTAWLNNEEIKSVILNLVVNSLDSMDDGGTLTITQRHSAGMAEMTFSDTGCGMTPEVLENIFEPFFTRSRTGKGTGLGLSISHRIVSQHRGEIEAASQGTGLGSTFTVRLPAQATEEQKADPHDQRADDTDPEKVFQRSERRGRKAA